MRYLRGNSKGDTLIEVTLALAILAMVLVSTYAVATRAYKLGQEAQIRRQVSALMVEQAEHLRNLRDNSADWVAFLTAIGANGPSPTTVGSFHMDIVAGVLVKLGGSKGGTANSSVDITAQCAHPYFPALFGSSPDRCDFIISGSWDSGTNTSSMTYWLVNNKILQPPS